MKVNCITINTDASFHEFEKGRYAAGFAFWIKSDQFTIKKGGIFKTDPTSPTDAEIMCIGNAIAHLLKKDPLPKSKCLIVNTDSMNGMRRIKDPKHEIDKQVQHLLIKLIRKTGSKLNEIRHVRAHTGINDSRSIVNEWCDSEAKKFMRFDRSRKKVVLEKNQYF
jgi:ribonuclease HI